MIDIFSYEKFENGLSNFSFVLLFFSMMAYWFETSSKIVNVSSLVKTSGTVEVSTGIAVDRLDMANSFTPVSQTLSNMSEKNSGKKFQIGTVGLFFANISLFTLLSLRWIESGHFPLSNLYESLMFLSWALTFFHLIIEKTSTVPLFWLGSITSPIALFTDAFANFSLPSDMQHSSALVPALQSNWLMMHVTVMILSYAALIFGSLLSIGFLILTSSVTSEQYENALTMESNTLKNSNFSPTKLRWSQNLDNLSYRMLGIGFPLLTIGILSGAVWANEAWGSYWSWDPKETWALLTWLVFAIYLHSRITKNWQGKKPAMIASFGFFVVWVCYLGVNLLGEGLHSYGWLKS
jgi:cytochrome c-type biogenesis protein CcsB